MQNININAHNIVSDFMKSIGMDGFGFNDDGECAISFSEHRQLLMTCQSDGIWIFVPFSEYEVLSMEESLSISHEFLMRNQQIHQHCDGYFAWDRQKNCPILIYFMANADCELTIFSQKILKIMNYCENISLNPKDSSNSQIFHHGVFA